VVVVVVVVEGIDRDQGRTRAADGYRVSGKAGPGASRSAVGSMGQVGPDQSPPEAPVRQIATAVACITVCLAV